MIEKIHNYLNICDITNHLQSEFQCELSWQADTKSVRFLLRIPQMRSFTYIKFPLVSTSKAYSKMV